MFFRGGLFRGIRRGHGARITVVGVALFFATAHMDVRHFLPIFLIGLVVTYARAASGSLIPGLLVHATFNATSVLGSFGEPADLAPAGRVIAPAWALAGLAGTAALLSAYHLVTRKSALCSAARELDLH